MNNIFRIPPQILYILQTLEQAGHSAYLVGGCVRDHLLGKAPNDFDICTSARPEETMALFDRCIPTGIAHGTVTVLYDGMESEVTVFRKEADYSDHRHPDGVEFTDDLKEDLSRRDFTINAMAMDCRGMLQDPWGGQADLQAGIIRCVGDPRQRLQEDALRMHRGLRFSAQLGFVIEPETLRAIAANAPYSRYVAAERIQAELTKTLLSARPEKAGSMIALGLLEHIIPEPVTGDLRTLHYVAPVKHLRYARFLYLLEGCDVEQVLRNLKLEKIIIRSVTRAIAAAKAGLPSTVTEMKQLMSREDELTVECVCACGEYDRLIALRDGVLASGEPYLLRHLAVTGSDLIKLGIKGSMTGEALRKLLDAVIETPALNEKETLLKMAKKYPPCPFGTSPL